MNRLWVALATVVVVATSVSFGLSRWMVMHQPTASNLHDVGWLTRELKLNDKQSRAVTELETEFKRQLDAMCATHCAARFALGDELIKANVDVEKCEACVAKMNAAQAEAEQATLAHILKVRELLSDEQAKLYSSLIHKQVCTMPMGAP